MHRKLRLKLALWPKTCPCKLSHRYRKQRMRRVDSQPQLTISSFCHKHTVTNYCHMSPQHALFLCYPQCVIKLPYKQYVSLYSVEPMFSNNYNNTTAKAQYVLIIILWLFVQEISIMKSYRTWIILLILPSFKK